MSEHVTTDRELSDAELEGVAAGKGLASLRFSNEGGGGGTSESTPADRPTNVTGSFLTGRRR